MSTEVLLLTAPSQDNGNTNGAENTKVKHSKSTNERFQSYRHTAVTEN
jgi:hypothetical protein